MRQSSLPLAALAISSVLATLLAGGLSAACLNKFIFRTDGTHQAITLLTGKLTFQEAQTLAHDIADKKAAPLEWLDDKGKTISKQFGDLKIVRPMPVGCDDKPSGVVMTANFLTMSAPSGHITIRLPSGTVVFDEQKQ